MLYRNQNHKILQPARRSFLKACACTTLVLASPTAWSAIHKEHERKLSFHNLHTGESIRATYWSEGEFIESELESINTVLRDHRSGDIHAMDTDLLDQLYLLRKSIGSNKSFHVISGYRSPASNSELRSKSNGVAKKSLHMQGKAIDIRLPGTSLVNLRDSAKSLKLGGVGYYAKSDFVHVDTGRVRYW